MINYDDKYKSYHQISDVSGVKIYGGMALSRLHLFTDLIAKKAPFHRALISNLDISGLDISGIDFSEARFEDVDMTLAICRNTNFHKTAFRRTNIKDAIDANITTSIILS